MERLAPERSELLAIYNAARKLVKQLRQTGSPILASSCTQIAFRAMALYNRHDMLAAAYRRQITRLSDDFLAIYDRVQARHPDFAPGSYDKALEASQPVPNQAIRVTITLPASEWHVIDEMIAHGHARSRAEYFRKAHFREFTK